MKKIKRLILLAMMLLVAAIALPACKEKNKVQEILIAKNDAPQNVYVLGQDLDFTDGVLTVVETAGEKTIPMTDAGITASGYDKNTLGKQEVTITYKGKTTTFSVKVVERIVAENYDREYFVGEPFNVKKGQLVITKDDGTNFKVNISDSSVTVGKMDSSKAADTVAVPVTYEKDTTKYTGSFNVTVYEADDAKSSISNPRDTVYQSYETDFSVEGCFLTLKSADGKLERYVPVTMDMVSGFDPTKATKEHKETPLTQVITVDYVGNIFTFNVNIYYSDVTEIRAISEELSVIDWTGTELPEVTSALGQKAFEAAKLYFGLSDEQKAVLTTEEKETVIRAAAVYGYGEWSKAAGYYETVFKANGAGGVEVVAESVEDVEQIKPSLIADDKKLIEYTKVVYAISEEFADTVLYGETKIGSYLNAVYSDELVEEAVTVLNLMISLEATLTVPSEWTAETLVDYADEIKEAVDVIKAAATSSAWRTAYKTVSDWRGGDYFDILYTYYYGLLTKEGATEAEKAEAQIAFNSLQDKYLPTALEELYQATATAYEYVRYLSNYVSHNTYYYTNFIKSMSLLNSLSSSEDDMVVYLLYTLKFNGFYSSSDTGASIPMTLREIILQVRTNGFFGLMISMVHNDSVGGLWNVYGAIVQNLEEEDYKGSETYETQVKMLWDAFVAMSPADQYAFFLSLHNAYGGGSPEYALDYSEGNRNPFVGVLVDYFTNEETGVLNDSVKTIFQDVLLTMENLARRYVDEEKYLTAFAEKYKAVDAAYQKLSDEDKANFDAHLGSFYTKYKAFVDYLVLEEVPDLTEEWNKVLDEFATTLSRTLTANSLIANEKAYYSLLFASYENAVVLANKIMTEAPDDVKNFFMLTPVQLFTATDEDGNSEELWWSLDYTFYQMRLVFVDIYLQLSSGGRLLFDMYNGESELHEYIGNIGNFMYTSYWNSVSTKDKKIEYVKEDVLATINGFLTLSDEQQWVFSSLDANFDLFGLGLKEYFATIFTEEAAAAAENLLVVQEKYVYCMYYQGAKGYDKILADFNTAYDIFLKSFQDLDIEEVEAFAEYFQTAYEFYEAKYAELNAAE